MTSDVAKDKAARLLRKRTSVSSAASSEMQIRQQRKHGSISTMSFTDDPRPYEIPTRPAIRMEPTYQLKPPRRFPESAVRNIIKDVFENYLSEEKYEPELCRQMSKTLSEVVKARVKDLMLKRYKLVSIVHIGQLKDQGLRMGSRCLWDQGFDTFTTFEYRNNHLFAVGTVYGIYAE